MATAERSPRRWNSDRYPKAVTVRVASDEHAEILRRAAAFGLSASRYLARRGLHGRLPPMRDAYPPSPEDRRQIETLVAELRRVGVNLNQLARRAHRARLYGGFAPSEERIGRASAQVEALVRILKNRL